MRAMSCRVVVVTATLLVLCCVASARAQESVVKALFFYSPTCPHCHQVATEVLPGLRQQYGDRFVIVGVDVATQGGFALYMAIVGYFGLPESRQGVPALVVGTDVMVGSVEIPQRLPRTLQWALAGSGIDWPPVPEVREALAAQGLLEQKPVAEEPVADTAAAAPDPRPSSHDSVPAEPASAEERPETEPEQPSRDSVPARAASAGAGEPARPPSEAADTALVGTTTSVTGVPEPGTTPSDAAEPDTASGTATILDATLTPDATSPLDRPSIARLFMRDPLGNGIAVGALVFLVATLAWSLRAMLRPPSALTTWSSWWFPALGIAGAVIATYLSFVEVTGTEAVCGPVGDCNTVQQSSWARLFGVIPVGLLGLAGYGAMLVAWGVATGSSARLGRPAWMAAWAMAFVGTAFSAYLTFLEPFVIGATCAWCVSSAVSIALMLVVATGQVASPTVS